MLHLLQGWETNAGNLGHWPHTHTRCLSLFIFHTLYISWSFQQIPNSPSRRLYIFKHISVDFCTTILTYTHTAAGLSWTPERIDLVKIGHDYIKCVCSSLLLRCAVQVCYMLLWILLFMLVCVYLLTFSNSSPPLLHILFLQVFFNLFIFVFACFMY
jgi:hypothetical protein